MIYFSIDLFSEHPLMILKNKNTNLNEGNMFDIHSIVQGRPSYFCFASAGSFTVTQTQKVKFGLRKAFLFN